MEYFRQDKSVKFGKRLCMKSVYEGGFSRVYSFISFPYISRSAARAEVAPDEDISPGSFLRRCDRPRRWRSRRCDMTRFQFPRGGKIKRAVMQHAPATPTSHFPTLSFVQLSFSFTFSYSLFTSPLLLLCPRDFSPSPIQRLC